MKKEHKKIHSEDISVVIQGAIDCEANKSKCQKACESVRQVLPGAEIILSTWKGSDTKGLTYDKLILNQDPGEIASFYDGKAGDKTKNNINRQIVSTKNGIKAANRKYVMKLRSDSRLYSQKFLKYYEWVNSINEDSRLLVFEPRNPYGYYNDRFCICDFWFFGIKENMRTFWDIPLYRERKEKDWLGEEYICLYQLSIFAGMSMEEIQNVREEYLEIYKEFIIKRFCIIPARKSGIISQKYPTLNSFCIVCLKHYVISFSEWNVWKSKYDGEYVKLRFYAAYVCQKLLGNIVKWMKGLNIND